MASKTEKWRRLAQEEADKQEKEEKQKKIEQEGEELPIAPWNFTWIVKHELAIMGYPKSKANMKYITEEGISHLISLSPEKQPPFETFPKNLKWTPIDILEFEAPTLQQILTFLDICRSAQAHGEAVGVHCRMGKGRSGVMAACYLVAFYDLHPDKAITNVRLAMPGSIETYAQEKVVKGLYDHLLAGRPRTPPVIDELEQYKPENFVPDPEFKTRSIHSQILDKYSTHYHSCPTVKHAKKSIRRVLNRYCPDKYDVVDNRISAPKIYGSEIDDIESRPRTPREEYFEDPVTHNRYYKNYFDRYLAYDAIDRSHTPSRLHYNVHITPSYSPVPDTANWCPLPGRPIPKVPANVDYYTRQLLKDPYDIYVPRKTYTSGDFLKETAPRRYQVVDDPTEDIDEDRYKILSNYFVNQARRRYTPDINFTCDDYFTRNACL